MQRVGLLAVSAIGADRPGIVAAVTGVLYDQGCNLEDTSMTILRGHFAMTMVVSGPRDAAELDAALAGTAQQLGLVVTVREISAEPNEPPPAHPYVVSVHGADHPGIVHRITALLAERGVNVTDLTTRLREDAYLMELDVEVPADEDVPDLSAALDSLAAELAVAVRLHPADADLL